MNGRRRYGAIAAAVVAVVAAAALLAFLLTRGDGRDVTAPPAPSASAPTSAEPEPAIAPLTGLGVDHDIDHPAVAVKVSDVRQAHPQLGVDRADIVFVEPIGVSYTRLLAVFHSDLPDLVGPVRSARPMDVPLLAPLEPVFGNTMASEWVMDYVDSFDAIDNLGSLRVSGSGAYVTDAQRPRPDHVFVKPTVLLELSEFTAAPEPYFAYAPEGSPSSAESAGSPGAVVEVPYGTGWTVTWTYDAATGRYLREQPWGEHTTADGVQVGAVNVLVLKVDSALGKIGTGRGAPVPILDLVHGSGEFVALAEGRSVTGTWSKAEVEDPFVLETDDGDELLLAPGNTWVELPATSAAVVTR